jgi:indolepyruvate ferredoxin oxidoreductase
MVARRVDFLSDYQDAAWAQRYARLVQRVGEAEQRVNPGSSALAEAVARGFFKLMSYKDEYEVARLHADEAFRQRLASQFEGDFSLRFHLAPPLFSRRNSRGELQKSEYGPWVMGAFRLLARFKRLRGTPFDPFGRTEERRTERRLIDQYEEDLNAVLARLTADSLPQAVELAQLPMQIRGFGHVKERAVRAAQQRRLELLAALKTAAAPAVASV